MAPCCRPKGSGGAFQGEVSEEVNGALIVDMVVSFAWHQLVLGRVAESMDAIEGVVDGV